MQDQLQQHIESLASRVKLLILDFDGVLTSNTVYVLETGIEAVRCWRGDGIGLTAIKKLGIKVSVLSKETNPVVTKRCEKLKIDCTQACDDKEAAIYKLIASENINLDEVAYIGNDTNDIPALKMVGLPIVVADSHQAVMKYAKYITQAKGGCGAVREVCDVLTNIYTKSEAACSQ
jgi:3-deoxy-D-manno-octulosonate 8-phosphate phosphatase (KDO 8-P phosphatase)